MVLLAYFGKIGHCDTPRALKSMRKPLSMKFNQLIDNGGAFGSNGDLIANNRFNNNQHEFIIRDYTSFGHFFNLINL
jgi:hypothetical protein